MGMLKEFREFAIKGNVVDMAVGLIIGAAFGKIVSSAVNDVLMPPLGMLMGRVDFSDLSYKLKDASLKVVEEGGKHVTQTVPPVEIKYGLFINHVLDFILVAFAVFLLVKQMNRVRAAFAHEEKHAPTKKTCPYCRSSIAIEATRCPECTSQLSPPDATVQPVAV